MMGWAVLIVTYALAQFEEHGRIADSMLARVLAQHPSFPASATAPCSGHLPTPIFHPPDPPTLTHPYPGEHFPAAPVRGQILLVGDGLLGLY